MELNIPSYNKTRSNVSNPVVQINKFSDPTETIQPKNVARKKLGIKAIQDVRTKSNLPS